METLRKIHNVKMRVKTVYTSTDDGVFNDILKHILNVYYKFMNTIQCKIPLNKR